MDGDAAGHFAVGHQTAAVGTAAAVPAPPGVARGDAKRSTAPVLIPGSVPYFLQTPLQNCLSGLWYIHNKTTKTLWRSLRRLRFTLVVREKQKGSLGFYIMILVPETVLVV